MGEAGSAVPRAVSFRAVWMSAVLALPVACVGALLTQALRDPDSGFPPERGSGMRPLGPRISEALVQPKASLLECSVDEVNAHLAKVLPQKWIGGRGVVINRAAVRVEGERGEWMSEHAVWGQRVVLRISVRVWAGNGRIQIQKEGVFLGRLAVGRWAQARLEGWLERVWPLFKKEHALLQRVDGYRAEAGRVMLKIRAGTPVPDGG